LRNEITNFEQRFDESFSEAYDRFKYLLQACPHHGFLELHQLDTFYNTLNSKDQDSFNSADGVSTNASTSGVSPDVAKLKDMVKALLIEKKGQNQSPALMKAVEESCVTCGVNYNQGNTSYPPQMMSNQIRPPGFPPVPNNKNVQINYQNHFIPNQNRGNNFNQGPVYQPLVFQQPAYQAPANQALAPQTQGVSKEDFSAYVKANDAVMKNMQTQDQNMQNQLTNLTDLIIKFVNSNATSTSSSGTLPSNTIANPKSDLKAITTRSGVSYDGPQIPPLVVENEPKATMDTVNPTNNGNTKDVQPQAVQSKSPISTESEIASVSASKPNPKALIPYPSKRNDERNRDPGKFLIPCDFPCMAECLALADLIASINLMPFSMWKRLSLLDLIPTCMTLELADRSISRPVGVAEDVYVKTGRALIDVFDGELTLRVGKEAITFNMDQTSRYYVNYSDMMAKRIDVIDIACEEYSQGSFGNSDFLLEEVDAFLAIEDEPTSSQFQQPYLDPEGDIHLLEAF
nr:reverse transcriptase domain-containing protein [Tanacetum cinerariifolium]